MKSTESMAVKCDGSVFRHKINVPTNYVRLYKGMQNSSFTERIYHLVILKLDQSDTHMHTK